MSFRKSTTAVVLATAATVGLLVGPGQAAADPGSTAAAPGSVITYTRTQTKALDQEFAQNSAATASINGLAGALCAAAGGPAAPVAAPVCGAQVAIIGVSIAWVRDTTGEAARANQCLKLDLAPNPRVDSPPLPSINDGPNCLD